MDDEKQLICFQSTAAGVSVCHVALRYAVGANLIFRWLRDPRYAPDPVTAAGLSEGSRLLPVEIDAATMASAAVPFNDKFIEIELAGSHAFRDRRELALFEERPDRHALARVPQGFLFNLEPAQHHRILVMPGLQCLGLDIALKVPEMLIDFDKLRCHAILDGPDRHTMRHQLKEV